MKPTRRRFVQSGSAAGALTPSPPVSGATGAARRAHHSRRAHGDLRVFDPVWTTANMTSYHAAMSTTRCSASTTSSKPSADGLLEGLSDDRKTYNSNCATPALHRWAQR